VFVHLVGVLVFAAAHGASMFLAFRLRGESDPAAVAGHLATSQVATRIAYVGLVLLAVGGLGAAASAGLLLAPWVVASYVVSIVVIVVMYTVATPYYGRLRKLVAEAAADPDGAALTSLLASRRPEVLLLVGGVGLLVLFWLMVFRPT
jgi:hypothetical protein